MEGEINFLEEKLYPESKLELNLESFSGLRNKDKENLARVFCTAKDLIREFSEDKVLPLDIFWKILDEIKHKEFECLYDFLRDIGVFREGRFVSINRNCEYVIDCELVD